MKDFVKSMEGLPKIVKILLALPVIDIVWAIYRICRSAAKKSTLGIVLGILLLIFSPFLVWILDIITIALNDRVLWID